MRKVLMWVLGMVLGMPALPAIAAGALTVAQMQASLSAQQAQADCTDLTNAMTKAQQVHMQIAAINPNIEDLFSNCANCFSGATALWDLSPAIPSLATIISIAEQAVLQYLQQQVCTAVNKVEGMVVSSINSKLSDIGLCLSGSGLSGAGGSGTISLDMSGCTASGGSGLTAQTTGSLTSYSAGTASFNSSQVDYGGLNATQGAAVRTFAPTGAAAIQGIQQSTASISAAAAELADVQGRVGPADQALAQAKAQLATCGGGTGIACEAAQAELEKAQSARGDLNTRMAGLLATIRSGSNGRAASAQAATPAAQKKPEEPPTFWSRVGSLFDRK